MARGLLGMRRGDGQPELVARSPWARLLVYAVMVAAVVQLPLDPSLGPLNDPADAEDYVSTMWQVVAAALGVSVALVAFAFQAFQMSGQRAYGGSLKEFAHESRLVWLIEVGVVALFVDGAVLAGWGSGAPGGWSGAWAMLVSGFELFLVAVVVHRGPGLARRQSAPGDAGKEG